MSYKKTKLYQDHLDLKGNMVPFSGFLLPTHYTSIKEEHLAVRNSVGLFDVSHMGEIIIKGRDALNFINYTTTNDINTISDGDAQYSLICNEKSLPTIPKNITALAAEKMNILLLIVFNFLKFESPPLLLIIFCSFKK